MLLVKEEFVYLCKSSIKVRFFFVERGGIEFSSTLWDAILRKEKQRYGQGSDNSPAALLGLCPTHS